MAIRLEMRAMWHRVLAAFVGALMLAACAQQELYENVSETEANEMVAVLTNAGIQGEKRAGEDGQFTVTVANDDFARSVDILRESGLPREKFESLGTVFKKEGFTSTPLAEKARLVYGLSQELSKTISEFDGVVEARVHLSIPESDPLTGTANPASASIFVKYRPGFDLRSQSAAIKALVTNSIEGLEYDKVSLALNEAQPIPTPPPQSLSTQAAAVLVPVAALGGGLLMIYAGWQFYRRRRALGGRKGQASVPAARNPGG